MGSKASKPQPSARTPSGSVSERIGNAWRSVKRSPRIRKKSKDSQKSKKSTDSESSSKKLQRQTSSVSKTGVELGMTDDAENGNESPTEHERRDIDVSDKNDIINDEVIQVTKTVDLPEPPTQSDDSFVHSCENNNYEETHNDTHEKTRERTMPTNISGLSKGALSIDDVPAADESSNENSPRSHDDVPVTTVFAFENDNIPKSTSSLTKSTSRSKSTSSRDRKTSRESGKSQPKSQNVIEPTVDIAAIDKLLSQLDATVAELLAAALQCEEYLESEKDVITKDAIDDVNAIVGGTRLLCQDKMGRQFGNLCRKAKGEMPLNSKDMATPTNEDLEGFWELVMLQVEEARNKMIQLHEDKENSWQPKIKTPINNKKKRINKTPKTSTPKKPVALSEQQKKRDADRKSRLADMRAKKLAMEQTPSNDDGN